MAQRNRTFARLEVFPSYFVNRFEDFVSTLVAGVVVTKFNATTIQVTAAADDDLVALAVDGRWRWRETTVQRAHPGGAAGTWRIWAVAKENVIASAPQTNTDNTDYSFDLRITDNVSSPPVVPGTVDLMRLIGTLQWDGAQITRIDQTAGRAPLIAHSDTHRAGGADAITASALTAAQVLDVGQVGQVRAGRVLTVADFTTLMGLGTPVGLWNLSDLTNLGSGGALTNKGAVPFGTGILGAATTAAAFSGSTAQALYIADTGAADPFRIRTGSWGCWIRTAKRSTTQDLLAKYANSPQQGWGLSITSSNVLIGYASLSGTGLDPSVGSTSDINDDRWHHAVVTYDGTTLRLYVDGVQESQVMTAGGPLFGTSAPFNIGATRADGGTAATSPHFGRIDEAFVTPDVLSDDQVRLLYCAKVAHAYPVTPTRAYAAVTRRRRGPVLAAADFPSTPLRLYNLVNETLVDLGSANVPLTNPGGGVTDGKVAGPDGARSGAVVFSGAHTGLTATDAGLPAGTATRSFGAWFKTLSPTNQGIVAWGTNGTADARMVVLADGRLQSASGGDTAPGVFAADGVWHFGVVVEDNAAADGVKRKLYMDGRLVGSSTVLTSLTLAGANRFRVGAQADGTIPITGSVARAFVHSIALTPEQIMALYAKGAQALGVSPVPDSEIVEAFDATYVYFAGDQLASVDQLDLKVAA